MEFTSLVLLGTIPALLYLVYLALLPKPIPGIPYNAVSAKRLLGDVQALNAHIATTEGGTFDTYVVDLMRKLNTPLIQVFVQPFGKPILILGDFQEAYSIFVRRTHEFDRSNMVEAILSGLVPNHHIFLKTGKEWKAQRRRWAAAMSTPFLHQILAPVIHDRVGRLVELWKVKSRIAGGRPWVAADDLDLLALEVVMAFTFGGAFEHNAMERRVKGTEAMGEEEEAVEERDQNAPIVFPSKVEGLLDATLGLTKTMGELRTAPFPRLKWPIVHRRPVVKEAFKAQKDYIRSKLLEAAEQRKTAQSAVEVMVTQERDLAKEEERQPDYLSPIMFDEIMGFAIAGYETTGTSLGWGVKYLTDHVEVQRKLRLTIEAAFPAAREERREPTFQEILNAHIPYLEGTIEEILRFANPATTVDREAIVDTQVLGHAVPKGTIVACILPQPTVMSRGFDDSSKESQAESRASWDPAGLAQFDPERWITRGENGDGVNRSAAPQMAFGMGPRQCGGKALVYVAMRTVLIRLMWNFELLPCPEGLSEYHTVMAATRKPKHCYVRLREISRE